MCYSDSGMTPQKFAKELTPTNQTPGIVSTLKWNPYIQDGCEPDSGRRQMCDMMTQTSTVELPKPGTNCIKIGLRGKLILSKRKGLREVLFS